MATKNYKPVTYSVNRELPKPQQEVFNSLITLKEWWPEDFQGKDVERNSECILTTGDSHYSKNKVIDFLPGKKFAWRTTESIRQSDGFYWRNTKFIFALAPKGNNTLITFTCDGVVFADEYDRLVKIGDMTLTELFYNFMMQGQEDRPSAG